MRLADASNAKEPAAYASLGRWLPQDGAVDPIASQEVLGQVESAAPGATQEDYWTRFRLQFMASPDSDIPTLTRGAFEDVVRVHQQASVWAIEIDQRLLHRLAAIRAIFAATQDPEFLSHPRDVLLFPGAQGLLRSQMYGFAAYLDPAVLVAAPWLLGVSAYRFAGAAVILFGEPVPGFRSVQAPELIHLFRPLAFPSSPEPLGRPDISVNQGVAVLRWWVAQVNLLLSKAVDPTLFRTADGTYDPVPHMGVLLSLERLFVSAGEILVHSRRDDLVRAVFLFDVLDILEGLGNGNWEQLLSLPLVTDQLEALRTSLPSDTGEALLSHGERGRRALAEVAAGFPAVTEGRVVLPLPDETTYEASTDRAAAHYLRLVRNARHSFSGMARKAKDTALLAAHNGEIPDELADLAIFHLVRFLSEPRLPGQGR